MILPPILPLVSKPLGVLIKRLLTLSPEPQPPTNMDTTATTSEVDMTTLVVPLPTPTISKANIPAYRYLQKLTFNLARASHHIEFLSNCTTKGITPAGLQINIQPQLSTIEGTL